MELLQRLILKHVYRCLNCDEVLKFRDQLGRKIDPIRCACGAAYARTTVLECDPGLWEFTRTQKAFTMSTGPEHHIYLTYGLGVHPRLELLRRA